MAKPIPPDQLSAVMGVIAQHREGSGLLEIASALSPMPPLRNLQRWLGALIKQGKIERIGATNSTRYRLPVDGSDQLSTLASPVGQAIQRLVRQPLAERAAADYRRIALDAYRPNQTYYLPAAARARLAVPVAATAANSRSAGGVGMTSGWRAPAIWPQLLADLAWRSTWLECQWAEEMGGAPTRPEVTGWLGQAESLGARSQAQLVWNHRSALEWLAEQSPELTRPTITGLYARLIHRLPQSAAVHVMPTVGGPLGPNPPLLRAAPLSLARSTYLPPADPWLIESCFDQILTKAVAVSDPVEQAFFLLVHLLYLQPFAQLNVSMTGLLVNVPLLRAGLSPVTLAGVPGGDLLDGLLGSWELNRTELLRDLFVAAADDCRARYSGAASG